MDLKEIEGLLRLFEDSSLTELVVEEGGMRVTFRRDAGSPRESPLASADSALALREVVPRASDRLVVRSPCVGTFSSRPAVGSDAFVRAGDAVKEGDTLAVVEAMKIITEVKAPGDGVVEKILVQDRQPVEFGQELMIIAREPPSEPA
ncbi:acetyl-CoA carboxylase biotin carboxyl carrier protein [Candidatus Bipolaricaulota bacterium]|nr:acetyl-CoA carboxylase biotin carboxyl carrier protein [Candidatus Bipolaricaulota bacterium]